MISYPGLAGPELRVVAERADTGARLSGPSFEIESLTLVGNSGTYLDSPYHYHRDGADLGQLPLERLVNVPIAMVRAVGKRAVTAVDLGAPRQLPGRGGLVHNGWAQHWGTPRYLELDCPHLTADAVAMLIDAGAALARSEEHT